jgi:hypothetical protein
MNAADHASIVAALERHSPRATFQRFGAMLLEIPVFAGVYGVI